MENINEKIHSGIMSIVTTHKCTRACPFCIDAYRGSDEFISTESIAFAVDFAKRKRIKNILLVGGEPTAHPGIEDIAAFINESKINCSITTNYDKPDVVKKLDRFIGRFNISNYDQKTLPHKNDFDATVMLTTLLWDGRFKNIQEMDMFIDKYSEQFDLLKFLTLGNCNDWTNARKDVGFIADLDGAEPIRKFGKTFGLRYKGTSIIDHDISESITSYKVHVDGAISTKWERENA